MRRSAAFVTNFLRYNLLPSHKPVRTMMSASTNIQQIATHNGTFHCDEVLACHMLRNHTSTFQNASIVRSRDPAVLAGANIVVDVGGEYDVSRRRFDHHQRGFSSTFEDSGLRTRTKLSSAGLIFKHFGEEVVRSILVDTGVELSTADLNRVFLRVYDCFMEAVDAIDNGVERYVSDEPPRYESSTDLSSRVGHLNPEWYEKEPDFDAAFHTAMALVGAEFDDCVRRVATSWLPAYSIVATAFTKRKDEDPSCSIMVLREWAPWKDHVYALEAEECQAIGEDKLRKVLYVVYQDTTGNSWRVQCVSVSKGSFQSRKPLPEPWRGLRDDDLSKITEIDDCIFVHASGFIGGNKSFDGALSLAKKALDM